MNWFCISKKGPFKSGLDINTLRPRQNQRHFADDIFKSIFLNENARISLKISLKFVPKVRINNTPALVQIMAWRRPGDKALSEPMMVNLLTHICVTRPQWVKHLVYMPIGHMVLKIYVPCKKFHVPSQYLYKPCKAYAYCWENKNMPRLKNYLPSRARNHKSSCAPGQDLHAPSMRARLNVKPCKILLGALTCGPPRALRLYSGLPSVTEFHYFVTEITLSYWNCHEILTQILKFV